MRPARSPPSGTPTDTGDLNAADPDNAADAWQAVAAGAATTHGFGTFALTANGVWTYTLDNSNAAVQALKAGDTLTDTFTVLTADGTAQVVTVTIRAQNDAPEIDLNGAGAGTGAAITFTEGGAPTPIAGINATVSDANDAQLQSATIVLTDAQAGDVLTVGDLSAFGIASSIDTSVAGRITVTLTGAASLANYQAALKAVTFSSASENPATADRHIEVSVSDGQSQSNTAIATLAVIGLNDAPVNTVPGTQVLDVNHKLAIAGLAVADPDAGAAAITTTLSVAHGTLTVDAFGGVGVAGSGTGTVTLTGSVAQINAALAAAGNVVYAPAQGFSGADTLTMTTNDNGHSGNAGALSDTDVVKITVNNVDHPDAPVIGTPGNDSFTALPGNERIDAFGGIDTVTFDFRLVDAAVTHDGNKVIIDGPGGSHTVLTGVERFVFTDGTVDNADGDVLVDDLFYYAQNHDVWTAHADADAHYHAVRLARRPRSECVLLDRDLSRSQSGREGIRRRSAGPVRSVRLEDRIFDRLRRRRLSVGQSRREGRRCRSARAFPRQRRTGRAPGVRAVGPAGSERLRLRLLSAATIRTLRPRTSIRSSISRRSAGRRGAIRTPCSTPTSISRPTPTCGLPASIRSTITTSSAGTRAAIRRPVSIPPNILATTPMSRRRRSIRSALPAIRPGRGALALRGRTFRMSRTRARRRCR